MAKQNRNNNNGWVGIVTPILVAIIGTLIFFRFDVGAETFYNYLYPFYILLIVLFIFALVSFFFLGAAWFTNLVQKSDNDRISRPRRKELSAPWYTVVDEDVKGLLENHEEAAWKFEEDRELEF